MNIETLDDWNDRLAACGCCLMPACPYPQIEAESVSLTKMRLCGDWAASLYGIAPPAGAGDIVYRDVEKRFTVTHSGTGFATQNYQQVTTRHHYFNPDDESCTWDYDQQTSGSSFCPFRDGGTSTGEVIGDASGFTLKHVYTRGEITGDPDHMLVETTEHIYSNPIADPLGYLIGQAETIFNKAGFDAANGASTSSMLTVLQSNPVTGTAVVIRWRKARYRWRIPSDFTGSYFKITWDEVFFPEEGDPVPVSTDKTATWTGPGDPQNEESWIVGEWNVLDPPASPGEVRVVNVRYECYRSPFGNKPQTTGETYDAPG